MPHFINELARYWKKVDESWRFAIILFITARLVYTAWSWAVFTIQPLAIQNFELRGEPILSIFSLKDSRNYVYLREVNGDVLAFKPSGTDHIVDRQTGSTWEISSGTATEGYYKDNVLGLANTRASGIFPYQGTTPYPGQWLAIWQRFDANIYVTIAENGYGTIPGDTHFPPLFPLLIRLLQPVFGNAFLAGLFISHLATLYVLKLLYDAFLQWNGHEAGKRGLVFFVLYPAFFFFFSAYSEALFLVCTLLSLRAMKCRAWAWAGWWTFCAILTRLQGVALILPMIYMMRTDISFLRRPAHWAGLTLAGLGGIFYLYFRSLEGKGQIFPAVESEWQARLALPGETYLYAIRTIISGNASFIDILNFAVATLFIILIIAGWRKIPLEYNLYAVINLFILSIRVVETQPLNSMLRFALTLFPAFYTLGLAGQHPRVRRVILYTFLPLNLYLSGQFFIWGWVA